MSASTSHHDYVIYLVLGHKDVSIILSTVIEDSAPSCTSTSAGSTERDDELHVSVGFPDLAGLTGTVVKTGQAVTVCGTDHEVTSERSAARHGAIMDASSRSSS